MENNVQIFNNPSFGEIRTVEIDNKPYFCGSDVAKALGYKLPRKAITDHCKGVLKWNTPTSSGIQEMSFIPEGDVYRLIVRSKLPDAEKFETWVFDDVLPTIRKTGGYIANEDVFTETYLPFADEQTKSMFKLNLQIITKQNKVIADQKKELEYQSSVIEGFTDNISLADKRRRITQIIRHNTPSPVLIGKRWNLLYGEFEKKYHMNLEARMVSEKYAKLKLKNKVDLIERGLNMTSELYGIACKLFESDYNSLLKEWSVAVNA